jgi:hypothetical protein
MSDKSENNITHRRKRNLGARPPRASIEKKTGLVIYIPLIYLITHCLSL